MYKQLQKYGKVKINEPLAKHTTFKIGGPADFFVTVTETEKLIELLRFLDAEGVEYIIFGGGSNVLISDEGFRGVVINIRTNKLDLRDDDATIVADAGYPTVEVAHRSMKAGLTGFEWGIGVPGTIGGAVRGNAGAMGSDMAASVEKIEIYKNGEVQTWDNAACEFGYRSSRIKDEGGVVLRVCLRLEAASDISGIQKAMKFIQHRNKTQPQGFTSAGCIFKNPDANTYLERLHACFDKSAPEVRHFLSVGKISAGWLIEQAGLKGKRSGKAKISERHGNFIVNEGGATARDVLTLIEKIKQEVYDKYGIELEEEIQLSCIMKKQYDHQNKIQRNREQ